MTVLLESFVLINTISIAYSEWLYADNYTLPRADTDMAVGTYNGSIFIIGGYLYGYNRQATEWNSITKEMLYYGDTYLSSRVGCWGAQYWTQRDEYLYVIKDNPPDTTIGTFNMKNKQLISDWQIIPYSDLDYTACIASSDDYLFVSGGGGGLKVTNSLYIFDFNINDWLVNAPSMNTGRWNCASIAYNGYLWVFAGMGLSTNERILIDNILENTWEYVDSLTISSYHPRAVAFQDYIYIIAGALLHIMDSNTGTVTLSEDTLPYAPKKAAVVLFDDSIHIFGGSVNAISIDTWIYYPLTTFNPTSDPSHNPTSIPTFIATAGSTDVSIQTMNIFNITPMDTTASSSKTTDTIPLITKVSSELNTTIIFQEGAVLPESSFRDDEQKGTDALEDKDQTLDVLTVILVFIICFISFVIVITIVIFIRMCFKNYYKANAVVNMIKTEYENDNVSIQKQANVQGCIVETKGADQLDDDSVDKIDKGVCVVDNVMDGNIVNNEGEIVDYVSGGEAICDEGYIVDIETNANMAPDEFEVFGNDETDGNYVTNGSDQ